MARQFIQVTMNHLTEFESECLNVLIERTLKTRGSQYPNPAVGAMVIKSDQIISEGYHTIAGTSHAEAIAIEKATPLTDGATLLITLEPCCHKGKTPPCVDRIIESNIRRVIWAIDDPNPKVYGKSKAILKQNGIDVIDNILPERGQTLIKEFYEFHTNKRPFIYVKSAMSLDGFISPNSTGLNYISNPKTLHLVHELRTCVQAICVGVNTVNVDQPRLSVRLNNRLTDFQPIIAIIDPHQKLDYDWVLNALNQGRKIIVFSKTKGVFESENFHLYPILTDNKAQNWSIILATLYDHNIQGVLVEGGASIFHSILNAGAFHELWVTKVPALFKSEGAVPFIDSDFHSTLDLSLMQVDQFDDDVVMRYKNNHAFYD